MSDSCKPWFVVEPVIDMCHSIVIFPSGIIIFLKMDFY